MTGSISDRQIEALNEGAPVLGEVSWRRADGTTGEYTGPVDELGCGIPRPDHGPGIRRALMDLAFGYVSGFPVRDILAYVFPGSFREAPVLEATAEEAQIAAPVPAEGTQSVSGDSRASGGLGERLRSAANYQDRAGAYDELRAMADEADELEAAYRVADAEIARLGEFHDHYRAQVERVLALAQEWARDGQTGIARMVREAVGVGTRGEHISVGRFPAFQPGDVVMGPCPVTGGVIVERKVGA